MTETSKITSHTISALILAAGKGTRMKSSLPKVLHPVMGRSMVEWVMDAAKKAGATDTTLVLSTEVEPFSQLLARHPGTRITVQKAQRGTGDAVASAAKAYAKAQCPPWADSVLVSGVSSDADWVLICAGDTPAINPQTIRDFIQAVMGSGRGLGVIGMVMNEPKGYGRMLKTPEGALRGIVEERDADAATKQITLCNSGVIFAKTDLLFGLLKDLSPNNAQGEYYLTDIFSQAVKLGHPAYIFETPQELEFQGVNDRLQLAQVETMMLRQRLASLMSHGVTIRLPETVYVEADVVIEPDVTLDPGVQIKGKTRISRNCIIGAQVVLEDAQLGAGVRVGAHAVVTRSSVKSLATIPAQACLADRDI